MKPTLGLSASTKGMDVGWCWSEDPGISWLCPLHGYQLILCFPRMSNTSALLHSKRRAGVGPGKAENPPLQPDRQGTESPGNKRVYWLPGHQTIRLDAKPTAEGKMQANLRCSGPRAY